MQNRAEALQNVESTIVELSSIFTQLATMVAQQGEVAIRYVVFMKPLLSTKHYNLSVFMRVSFFLSSLLFYTETALCVRSIITTECMVVH